MPKETYPTPGEAPGRPRLAYNNVNPEYGVTRAEWEERVFRAASHFNVVRINAGGGSEIITVPTFAQALHLAHNKPRHLIYVVSHNADAFCMAQADHGKYAELTLKMRGEKS